MLYFSLVLAVLLLPFNVRFAADTEDNALLLQAELVLLKRKIFSFYKGRLTVKSVVAKIFSRRKRKTYGTQIFNVIKENTKIKSIAVHARIGTGDAEGCALLCGGGYGLLMPLCQNLSRGRARVDIQPVFDESTFEFSGECIFSLNIANCICALLNFLWGKKKWKSILSKT